MLDLKEYSYYRIQEIICQNKFLVYSLRQLELQFAAQVTKFVVEVSKFETRVLKFVAEVNEFVCDVTDDRTFGPGVE